MTRGRVIPFGLLIAACVALTLALYSALGLPSAIVVGISVAVLYRQRDFRIGAAVALAITFGASIAGLCYEAVVRDGGDFTFDHEWGLVVAGIIFYLFVCLLSFWVTRLLCRRTTQPT